MSTLVDSRQTESQPKLGGHHGFRGDIEGLRALAVGLVIVSHAFGWPSGGFVGVDVFFVISGFLISGLILKERERTGTFSFFNFYARRVKRILPAATLVLFATVLIGYLIFFADRAKAIATDGLFALFFMSNWRFASKGTDYLAADGPTSPIQHYWSLSVEEQFYLVWPLLLIGAVWLAGRAARHPRVRLRLLLLVAICGLASYGWALLVTADRPQWAYFDTFGRAWEFAAGGAVAFLAPRLTALAPRLRSVAGLLGVGGLVASAVLITPDLPFPGPWALLPVAFATLIILAGTPSGSYPGVGVLSNPVCRFLGRISFSLYLWHFPAIIFLEALLPARPALAITAALALTVGLSVLSYRFVEEPFRKLRWLTSVSRSHPTGTSWANRSARLQITAIGGVFLLGMAAFSTQVIGTDRPTGNARAVVDLPYPASAAVPGAPTSATRLVDSVAAGLTDSRWPSGSTGRPVPQISQQQGCLTDPRVKTFTECRSRGGGPDAATAVVIGDSVAMSWVPGVSIALDSLGYNTLAIGTRFCPVPTVTVRDKGGGVDTGGFAVACDAKREALLERVAELRPEVVIVSGYERGIQRLTSDAAETAAEREWEQGAEISFTKLTAIGARVIVLSPPPAIEGASDCRTRLNRPMDCAGTISAEWRSQASAERQAVEKVAQGGGSISYVDTGGWFCLESRCPQTIDGRMVRYDSLHLDEGFSRYLAPVISEAVGPFIARPSGAAK